MKKLTLATIFLVTAALTYAGPACCGSKNKSALKTSNDLAELSKMKSKSGHCSIEDISKCFSSGKELSTIDLKNLIDTKANIVLIDARTPKWDDGKRIASAKNLTPDMDAAEIEKVLGAKDSYVVTYCGSAECPLSHKMANRLKTMGYTNVLVYPEGINGWTSAGYAVN